MLWLIRCTKHKHLKTQLNWISITFRRTRKIKIFVFKREMKTFTLLNFYSYTQKRFDRTKTNSTWLHYIVPGFCGAIKFHVIASNHLAKLPSWFFLCGICGFLELTLILSLVGQPIKLHEIHLHLRRGG